MNTRIDISIEFKGQQIDYQIPTEVTFGRLTELMHQVLKGSRLPQNWTLELKNKKIKMDDTDLIKDLPIGSGDVFSIVPINENTGVDE
ncbi:EsaB/YukD family protein [Lactococcus lactis]|uniref:EsaB/YukD family protein n=1 Tax=Lactococcus lactis TaxID=1358 RepID=UPI0024189AF5|nr:EsaB/YukD family protein [Lactococcus lactis]MDG4967424.1 EsaB/YukD family protein [Lactococcus lactis]